MDDVSAAPAEPAAKKPFPVAKVALGLVDDLLERIAADLQQGRHFLGVGLRSGVCRFGKSLNRENRPGGDGPQKQAGKYMPFHRCLPMHQDFRLTRIRRPPGAHSKLLTKSTVRSR